LLPLLLLLRCSTHLLVALGSAGCFQCSEGASALIADEAAEIRHH
jgi:hypothetical protein